MEDDITLIYNPLNLSIEKLREYNIEKYHFLSGILDILVMHFQVERAYNLTQSDLYKHFQKQNLGIKKEREKFNAAIAQLKGSDMININPNGIVGLTEKGLNVYDNQVFHSIAANLYSADRANHLAKVAIIAASFLTIITILCTIIPKFNICL